MLETWRGGVSKIYFSCVRLARGLECCSNNMAETCITLRIDMADVYIALSRWIANELAPLLFLVFIVFRFT